MAFLYYNIIIKFIIRFRTTLDSIIGLYIKFRTLIGLVERENIIKISISKLNFRESIRKKIKNKEKIYVNKKLSNSVSKISYFI